MKHVCILIIALVSAVSVSYGQKREVTRTQIPVAGCAGCTVTQKVVTKTKKNCPKQKGSGANGDYISPDGTVFQGDDTEQDDDVSDTSTELTGSSTQETVTGGNETHITVTEDLPSNTGIQPLLPAEKPLPVLNTQTPPAPVETDCYQRMQLTKFFTDSSMSTYVETGLAVKYGKNADTLLVEHIIGSTKGLDMNVTSSPRTYVSAHGKASNGLAHNTLTRALFTEAHVESIQLQRYCIIVQHTKKYDVCKVKEVVQKYLYESITRRSDGKGNH